MQVTGSQQLITTLLDQGIETVFGYPGGAIMPVYDALYDYRDRLRHILVRHEQGAVIAAIGYARALRTTGVCLATSGPGATNLITGIADAMMDSVPIVCITGQVASSFLGTDAFQESDIIGMTVPITKWNYQITSPNEIPRILEKAFAIARQGRPGPVLIDITKDAQTNYLSHAPSTISTTSIASRGSTTSTVLGVSTTSAAAGVSTVSVGSTASVVSTGSVESTVSTVAGAPTGSTVSTTSAESAVSLHSAPYTPRPLPPLNPDAITAAAALLNRAERPLMFVGQGVTLAGAEALCQAVAERAHMPMVTTLLGLSSVNTQHPLFKGMLGMHGHYGPNRLSNQADVVLAVGMRFDDRVTGRLSDYLTQTRVIHIDIDEAEFHKNVPADVAIHADAKVALNALLPALTPRTHPRWHQAFNDCRQQEWAAVSQAEVSPTSGPLKMAEVVHQLSTKTQGQAILVTDVGQHQMVAARYYQFQCPCSHITSGGLGTMGFALPAAIGAKVAQPQRQVIMIAGDGGIQMNLQALGVVMQERLPVKMLVLNNHYLGMVRQWQELFFDQRYSYTALQNPDFVAIAQAYGIAAARVTTRETLSNALDEFLTSPEAYFLEVEVVTQHNVFPMVPSGASVSEVRLS